MIQKSDNIDDLLICLETIIGRPVSINEVSEFFDRINELFNDIETFLTLFLNAVVENLPELIETAANIEVKDE